MPEQEEDKGVEFNQIESAYVELLACSDKERIALFNRFCVYCGSSKRRCTCMRDE